MSGHDDFGWTRQGRDSEESTKASRAALGMDPDGKDPMESRPVRWAVALIATAMLAASSDWWVPLLVEWLF